MKIDFDYKPTPELIIMFVNPIQFNPINIQLKPYTHMQHVYFIYGWQWNHQQTLTHLNLNIFYAPFHTVSIQCFSTGFSPVVHHARVRAIHLDYQFARNLRNITSRLCMCMCECANKCVWMWNQTNKILIKLSSVGQNARNWNAF